MMMMILFSKSMTLFVFLLFGVLCFTCADYGEIEVELQVTSPSSSDEVVREADDSAQIVLRAILHTDSRLGISLYDCQAMTENATIILTDQHGCPADLSPLTSGCMTGSDGTVVSPPFPLSSLAEEGDVNITCSWDTCFSASHPKCMDRCGYFSTPSHMHGRLKHHGLRLKRQTDQSEPSWQRHVSTVIRVLRGSGRGHHHGDASGHRRRHGNRSYEDNPRSTEGRRRSEMDEEERSRKPTVTMSKHHEQMHGDVDDHVTSVLLYLNPITCSVFLLVIVVFLGVYATFVRGLRVSVDLLRQDVLAIQQQHRDKFSVLMR